MSNKEDMLKNLSKFFKDTGLVTDRAEYSSLADKPYSVLAINRVFKRFSLMLEQVKPLMEAKKITAAPKKVTTTPKKVGVQKVK